ncbi:hypothetical protein [Chromobacterium sp. IIBBL 290-4]|uniref:hypothetical protein n=1 Tax=Chromobacterium sp. IIBBL 290-4 TaxID=2953890 RepID=UPI0020B8CB23|nr:hypothetical protein [Chromobacterium sp. IIBBL 290-4]UTH76830.1 hypothetical protein NKT35_23985 [Chromobacterium sp. IIBBL 290-4]
MITFPKSFSPPLMTATHATATQHASDNLAVLAAIFETEAELCLYRRPPDADIAGYLSRAGLEGRLGLGWRRVLTPGETHDLPLAELPAARRCKPTSPGFANCTPP